MRRRLIGLAKRASVPVCHAGWGNHMSQSRGAFAGSITMRAKLLAIMLSLMGAALSASVTLAAAATVTSVKVSDLSDRVEVTTSVSGSARTSVQQSPAGKWIVLNIGAKYAARPVDTGLRNDAVRHIRVSGNGPGLSRVSVATGRKIAYSLSKSEPGQLRWVLWKGKPGSLNASLPQMPSISRVETPAQPVSAQTAETKKGTQITGMQVFDKPDRVEIRAITDGKVGAWCNRGLNGRVISLGIMADYKTKPVWQGILNENVVHVDAGLFQSRPAMSRVVVSVTKKVPYDLDTTGNNSVILTVWKSEAARQAAVAAGTNKPASRPDEMVAAHVPEEFIAQTQSETAMGVVDPQGVAPATNFQTGKIIPQPVPVTEMALARPSDRQITALVEPAMGTLDAPRLFSVAPAVHFAPGTVQTAQISQDNEFALSEPARPVVVAAVAHKTPVAIETKVAGAKEEIDASQLKPGDVLPPSAELKATDPATGEAKSVVVKDAPEQPSTTGQPVAKAAEPAAEPAAEHAASPAPAAQRPVRAGQYASAKTRMASADSAAMAEARPRELVSLNFVGTDINDVLKALTMQSGSNIVTATDVKGDVTVSLQNVDFESALNSITKLSGYSWLREGNTYYVASDKSMAAFDSTGGSNLPTTQVIAFNNATSSEMLKLVSSQFPSLSSTIPAGDGNGRTLIVTGPANQIAEAAGMINRMDAVIDPSVNDPTVEVYSIRYSKAKDLLKVLDKLVPGVQSAPGAAPAGLTTPGSGSTGSTTGGMGGGAGAPAGASDMGSAPPAAGGSAQDSNASSGDGARTIVLAGPTALVKRALSILDKIDTPLPQVLIEAKVVDVDASDSKKLGITYDWNGNGYTVGVVNNVGNLDSLSQPEQVNPNLSMLPTRLTATIDGKVVNVNGNILASPKISVLDGQQARIFIGDVIRYIESIQANSNGTTVTTGNVSAGVDLQCMPLIDVAGDRVTMRIHPEASTPTFITDPRTGITLPQVATRYADSTIRVKSGQTIVIGGLISQTESNTLTKIPYLSDLPFLGQLFRHRDKSSSKRELMIFITSTILKDV